MKIRAACEESQIRAARKKQSGGRASPLLRRLVPFAALLILWLAVFFASESVRAGPNGIGLGGDFATFLGASQVLRDGGNPYDRELLLRTERALLRRQGLSPPLELDYVRVGNPPLFFWLIQPLTRIPFTLAALAWIATMALLCAAGMLTLLRTLGWRRRMAPIAIFLAMPQTILAVYYGNVDAVVFAGIAFSLTLLRRYPVVAGSVATLALWRPRTGSGSASIPSPTETEGLLASGEIGPPCATVCRHSFA